MRPHVRDLAYGRRDRVIDNDEVVVRVQRQLLGIERPFRDPSRAPQSRAHQLFRKRAGYNEKPGGKARTAHELTTRDCAVCISRIKGVATRNARVRLTRLEEGAWRNNCADGIAATVGLLRL